MEEKENLATTGTESFKLPTEDKERVVINIQEEQAKGVVIEKEKGHQFVPTGNLFVDWYRKVNYFMVSHAEVKPKDKAIFFHLLSVMIAAGIPMVKALRSLVVQMEKSPRLHMILEGISVSIEAGTSLSEAMLAYPDLFGEAEVGMIQAGEASGQITTVLDNLATDAEKAYAIKAQIKSAMMYPIVILFLLVAVVSAMMIFVIPQLTELFASTKGELPMITKVVIALSDFMINRWPFLLAVFVALGIFFSIFKKTDVGKYAFDRFKLDIPIFGKLLQKAYLSRFARSLSNLLDSNVTIVRTLEITANSMSNEVYRRRILLSMEDIKQGIPLAENLSSSKLFPPMLVNMIDVGEKTAQMDEITAKIAKFYEDEVDTAVSGISKIIEPVMLIVMGVTVGAVVAAIMLPIMKLADLSGGL